MLVYVYTPDQVLLRGLMLASKEWTVDRLLKQDQAELITDFKAFYGSHPVVLAQLWEDLQTTTIPDARINTTKKRSVHLKNFLRANLFLKQYPTEKQRRVLLASLRTTIRTWTKYFVKRIQALKEDKIRWPGDNEWTHVLPKAPVQSPARSHSRLNESCGGNRKIS